MLDIVFEFFSLRFDLIRKPLHIFIYLYILPTNQNWMPTVCQPLFKCFLNSRERILYLAISCGLLRKTEEKQIHIILHQRRVSAMKENKAGEEVRDTSF